MVELRRLAARAGVRRRFAPHQLRHAHALELAREGVALNIIQRQLGHANLGTTSIYLQGIDTEEIIATVHARRAPMCPPPPDCGSDGAPGQSETLDCRPLRTRRGLSAALSLLVRSRRVRHRPSDACPVA
jgi:Phage integrase family